MFQLARQDSSVQLVKVHELDQVGKPGLPLVQAEEQLPVLLARQDLEIFDFLMMTQCENKCLWIALAVTEEEKPVHESLLFNEPV